MPTPPTPEDLYDQAVDCVADGDLKAAIEKYRSAIAINPDYADAFEGLSMALADTEQWDEAIAAARRVVDLNPDDQLPYTNLSRIYQRSGNVPEAEAWAAKGRMIDWKRQLKEGKP